MIPDEAVEAAWDKLHENPVRPIGIDYAELTAALEAAAPHMLADVWDEGEAAGQDNADSNRGHDIAHKYNPYRTAK